MSIPAVLRTTEFMDPQGTGMLGAPGQDVLLRTLPAVLS